MERAAVERLQGVEDVVEWHESTGLRQLAPVRQVLHRAGIRGPTGEDCPLRAGVQEGMRQNLLRGAERTNLCLELIAAPAGIQWKGRS